MAAEMDADRLRFIEEVTTNVDAVQERVLAEILARNADAEYLAKCGLAAGAAAVDRATFRAKVPMVTYEDLRPYILRIAGGDRSPILSGSGHPVSELLTSSGTSGGERKLIPTVADELHRLHRHRSLVTAVVNKYVPGLDDGSGLYFHFVKPETTTPGGLPARTLLTSIFKSDGFKKLPYDPRRGGGYTSPAAAVLCEDAFQSMYAQMLCGLCHRLAVLRVGAVFASGLLRAIRFFHRNWELQQLQGSAAAAEEDVVVVDGGVLERCCLEMEEALGSVYRQSRVADGAVGPLEIRVVRRGTFDELADQAVARGASVGQYKVPRCVVATPDIELLDSRVVSSHFSPALPHWAPGHRFE